MQEANKSNQIESYLMRSMWEHDKLYIKCLEAKCKFYDKHDYYYTDEDYDNFLMLASAWSAIIRKAWRIFIIEGDCEPFEFWNAFIKVFTFNQRILMLDQWKNMNKYHRRLKDKISRTSNPDFIEKMFVGMDWKWLHNELSKCGNVNR